MTVNLKPYGLLPDGKYGITLDDTTGKPRAAVLEVKDTLPPVADPENFAGRLVLATDVGTTFVYQESPSTEWIALEGVPATIGTTVGAPTFLPPVTGSEIAGGLFWATDTEVLFVWDGIQWQAAGGRYATTVIERRYIGDSLETSYALGVSTIVPSEHVEIFLNGVRQNSVDLEPGTGDYSIAGTNVVFTIAPALGVEIITRTLDTVQISQTATVTQRSYDPITSDNNFATGTLGTQPEAIIVTIDGVVQEFGPTEDYILIQQDTTINTFTKPSAAATTGDVNTVAAHGIPGPGSIVVIDGTDQPIINGRQFVVNSVGGANDFVIDMLATDPQTMLASPIMFFSPPFIGDILQFNSPTPFDPPYVSGSRLVIKSFTNIIVSPETGEANDLVHQGVTVGNQSLVGTKVGTNLGVKGIAPGSNISLLDNGTDIVVTAAIGANFENRVGANGALVSPGDTASYVGVLDSVTFSVQVNLSGTGPSGGPATAGRKITIKDEAGGAGTNNITVMDSNGYTFDGAANYFITTARGSVTLVFDGAGDWKVVAQV